MSRCRPISTTAGLAIVVLLLLINAFFVAGEFALVTVERHRVVRLAEEGDRKAQRILEGLTSLSFHLSGAQLGITLSSLVLGLIAEPAIRPLLTPLFEVFGMSPDAMAGAGVVVSLAIATGAQLVFGELIPKNLAITYPYATAVRVGRPMLLFNRIVSPIIRVLNASANRIVRLLGIEPREELAGVRSLEELELIIRASGEGGQLDDEELALLTRSIAFTENLTSDVMIPRVQVVGVPESSSVAEVQALAIESGHSRFPVFRDDLDDIVGVVHVKDTLRVSPEERPRAPVLDYMRPALVIPETQPVDSVLFELRTKGSGLAVVTDEYGGTAGIVTSEDLLEEIVGEIEDEYDATVTPADASPDELSGLLHRHEVFELTGFEWPEGRYETLGGLVTALLGRHPQVGDEVHVDDWRLEVTGLDGFRVETVRLTRDEEQT
ncbi:MAG: hemolysin family protein [Acidimicrobiia bacterium]